MTINKYFDNFTSPEEKDLYSDIIEEMIQIYGQDCYYVPRTLNSYDSLYGADAQSSYEKAFTLEMYTQNFNGFEGDKNVFTMAGLEIKDRLILAVSKRRFDIEVGLNTGQLRPNDGDLIYYPLYGALFQITYVEKRPYFYQFGDLPTYELHCELWSYAGETVNTGIPEIDVINEKSTNILSHGILTNTGLNIITSSGEVITDNTYLDNIFDPSDDSDQIQRESDAILDWDVIDPFSESQV